ncbi:hypothetical protein Y032_0252g226 [Ancylostoma ceylanicum]|uniref:Uncharacterized protein n=1 Tax=Ancylostoma ceylanicum TaxID=53326 RepID=A0A016SCW4_9BILA|nr:hypothetical protein Y032_0252g226 [Ancylostoma ceylanicum]
MLYWPTFPRFSQVRHRRTRTYSRNDYQLRWNVWRNINKGLIRTVIVFTVESAPEAKGLRKSIQPFDPIRSSNRSTIRSKVWNSYPQGEVRVVCLISDDLVVGHTEHRNCHRHRVHEANSRFLQDNLDEAPGHRNENCPRLDQANLPDSNVASEEQPDILPD